MELGAGNHPHQVTPKQAAVKLLCHVREKALAALGCSGKEETHTVITVPDWYRQVRPGD